MAKQGVPPLFRSFVPFIVEQSHVPPVTETSICASQ